MAGIFVSHAWADGEFVRAFVDEVLCPGCGVARPSVFFSYDPDTGIAVGADVNDVVQKRIAAEDILVLAMLTPTYLARPYCMAELGAAWSRSGTLFPLMLPEMGHQDLDGVLRGAMVKSVGDPGALDALKERIVATLGVESPATTWGRSRDRWIARLNEHLRGVAVPSTDEAVSSAACSREQGHMEVFWTDKAANVFYQWWLGANGWSKVHRMRDVEANYVAAVASDGGCCVMGAACGCGGCGGV